MEPQFKAIADHAVLVTFAKDVSEEAHNSVIALDNAIAADTPVGVIETVPALVNLLVSFDPIMTDHITIEEHIRKCLNGLKTKVITGVQRHIQVCYEASFAPDLGAVASATGLSKDAVINAHLAGDYHVLMYGFSPGYAYLSGVAEQIQVPRKPAPVRDVPAGSVIIAGPQCLITTLTMPTGWSIIGRSPNAIFTGDPTHPFLFDVGDNVTFERIDLATFESSNRKIDHG
ncbi:allophanate hydrolase subunit 1 [Octadecabacter sp. G9-8]|uniref:Allophanate hydrolase subunit 1 n=2 Tax=Octadecabacter dasysiphoniae TaxID=2909341 RepID=A0ABS9D0U7_9RHOB|nr:allophanate hydrolase subunit 1 [Octadecabacter dasysiphoniae]MCF2872011.1 allophanate hydrolase subunit 1 [Octadecabacter dasysiphoniae]